MRCFAGVSVCVLLANHRGCAGRGHVVAVAVDHLGGGGPDWTRTSDPTLIKRVL